ncbi:MAG: aminopeptidase P family protein [Actinomycetota bacterium]|nr:aminopeptidase P family protein [Actinomycetota bacterium]
MSGYEERRIKRARLDALLDAEGLDALVLRSPPNVAWWSGGGRTHVLVDAPVGVAAVVVTRDGETVLTDEIEAGRLQEEELAGLLGGGAALHVLPWTDDVVAALPVGERVGDDVARPGVRDCAGALEATRRSLTPTEVERYRALGRDAAAAMTAACSAVSSRDSEYAAAGRLAAALLERDIDPVLLLVAGEERGARWRHPLPTTAPLGGIAMLVTCARRHGLYANLTRFVALAPLPSELDEAYGRLLRVEAACLDALRPDVPVASVLAAGTGAYAAAGFAADEWRRHHQGGPTGYLSRDHVARPACSEPVEDRQAFAWNPSVPALKVEDTVLAGAAGVEVLTADPHWPSREVSGRQRPAILSTA